MIRLVLQLFRFASRIWSAVLKKYWTYKLILSSGSVGSPVFVGGPVSTSKRTTIGRFTSINGLTVKGFGEVRIEDFVHFGTDCLIITSNHDYDGGEWLPYGHKEIAKIVNIGRATWIGDRVIILGGVTIGEGAIIQAGAVVSRSVPALGIAGGNPAVVFKYRDAAHYSELRSTNKFLRW
jgi:acetyltransferase-like isoleucine patch superfamily enzyme